MHEGGIFLEKGQGFAAVRHHEEMDITAALFDSPAYEIDIGRIVFD